MYFYGTLTVDPSHMTEIEVRKPTNAFGKMCYYLTAGLASQKEEAYDSFTADKKEHFDDFLIEIKQALRRQIQVDNIRRHSERRIVRPSKRIQEGDSWAYVDYDEPMYHNYHGMQDFHLLYLVVVGYGSSERHLLQQLLRGRRAGPGRPRGGREWIPGRSDRDDGSRCSL